MSALRHRSARLGAIVVMALIVPSTAYADDCSSFIDCYGTLIAAALVIAVVALFIALTWEMWAAAALLDAQFIEAALLAEEIEAGLAADALAEELLLSEVTNLEEVAATTIFDEFPALTEVNKGGFTKNCGECARIADRILGGGAPGEAANVEYVAREALQEEFGSLFNETTFEATERELLASGDGSRGIMQVKWSPMPGGNEAHVFNAVNQGGRIVWVDTQLGTASTTPEIIAEYGKVFLKFMPTFPG